MITEMEAINIARIYATETIDSGWDELFHMAKLVNVKDDEYWEVNTNMSPSLSSDWCDGFFPSPIMYYVRVSDGECVGYKTSRDENISHPIKSKKNQL